MQPEKLLIVMALPQESRGLLERAGAEIHANILAGVRAGKLAAVIGQTARFEQIPAAIDAMGNRATVGRTVVLL